MKDLNISSKNVHSKYIIETEIGNENKRHLLYSLRSNKILILKPELYYKYKQAEENNMTDEELKSFIDGQFLVHSGTEELMEILKENKDHNSDNNQLYYIVQPTANCNFGCDYCGQEHIDFNMSEKTIKNTVSRIKSKLVNSNKDKLHIGWFGGEPLLAMDKMRVLNSSIKEMLNELNIPKYKGIVVTNGYLLDLDIYKELVTDFNINQIEITVDGDRESHDKRRIGKKATQSFDQIYSAIKSIVKSDFYNDNMDKCMISIRCNVDERNYMNASNLIDLLREDEIHNKVVFYIAPIKDWAGNNASSKSLIPREFNKLILDLNVKMLELGFVVDSLLPKRSYGICSSIEGKMEMVDALGKVWGCSETALTTKYKNSRFCLGNVNKMEPIRDNEIFKDYFNAIIDTKCKSCKLLPICGTGCPKEMIEGKKKCAYSMEEIRECMKVQATYTLLKDSNNNKA